MQPGEVNPALKPISWLIGKWYSVNALGMYPTIKQFEYCEELEFASFGQPILNYTSKTWHPKHLNPMHLESGFLRIKPGTKELALVVAHNFGLTSLEEGSVDENMIKLRSKEISRMSFAKEPAVTAIERVILFKEESGELQISLSMATTTTPMSEHLIVKYQKRG